MKKVAKPVIKAAKFVANEALDDPVVQSALKKGGRIARGTLTAAISTQCPGCAKKFNETLSHPVTRRILKYGSQKIKGKCPGCAKAMNVLLDS